MLRAVLAPALVSVVLSSASFSHGDEKDNAIDGKGTNLPTDPQTVIPKGGELHQVASGKAPVLTTEHGVPISDDQNSLRVGTGPLLMEDFHFREKIFHFDHERIPERVVHARGYGVHGYFENYQSIPDLTKADLFQRAGEKTKVFVRFSTVIGNKGSPDLARDVRGFAVKLYTQEGNWDLVGNNIPVFFIQDPLKFPDVVHAAKPEPDRDFPQAQTAHDNFWDFISLMPESMHMVMWIMSDRTIPRSYRFMEGFGVHSFRFINTKGESRLVKFHWKPLQGLQSVTWNEAVKINGVDPDYHRRDLWNAIQGGDFPQWELGVQLFNEEFAEKFDFDVLDSTKIIPEELVPIRPIGKLVLNKVVDNFFAETEQVAFCTQNIVPGIDFTDDPLLQGRNFSYLDTQLKRLGSPNFTQLPINAPVCPVRNFLQDGHMTFINPRGRVNYEPNSYGVGPRESQEHGFKTFPSQESGNKLRVRPERFADHYSQARQFYISQTPIEQQHITDALVFELGKAERVEIRARMVAHLLNIDEQLADKVAKGLRLREMPVAAKPARQPINNLPPSNALSILKNGPKTFAGRAVGVLVTDGVEEAQLNSVLAAIKNEKSSFRVIGLQVGGIFLADESFKEVNEKVDAAPSVLFDSVVILASDAGLKALRDSPAAKDFASDALTNHKFIGVNEAGKKFLKESGLKSDSPQIVLLADKQGPSTFIEHCRSIRLWETPSELTRESK